MHSKKYQYQQKQSSVSPGLFRPPRSLFRSALFCLSLLLMGLGVQLSAQSTQLDRYIKEGLANNLRMQQAELDLRQSVQELQVARANFMPRIAFEANYTLARGGRTIDIPIGDLLNPVYGSLNEITQSSAFPMLENVEEQLLPNNFHETKLTFAQPLFNSDVWFGWKARKDLIPVQVAKKNAYKNELVHEIRSAWFQHLQALEALKIYESSRLVLEELLRVNKSLVKNNKATPDIVFSAEAELAQLDQNISEASKNIRLASSWFNFLLNRGLDEPIITEAEAESIPELPDQQDLSIANRSELTQLRAAIQANQELRNLESARRWLPNLYVGGELGFQGFGYTFDAKQDYYLVRLGLNWNLFQGGAQKAKIQMAEIRVESYDLKLRQVQKQLEMQLIAAEEGISNSQASYRAAQKALTAAQQNFRIVNRKYEEGQALLIEFLQAQNTVTRSQLSENLQRFQLLIAHSELMKSIAQQ